MSATEWVPEGDDNGTGTAALSHSLAARIAADPSRFRFRQLVRLLTLAARRRGDSIREGVASGIRFRTPVSLAFPASEVLGAISSEVDGEALGCELEVGFLGLTGPSGVLPSRYTELLMERHNHHRDDTLHQFLDIFSHRAISLFYAAGQKYRIQGQLELGEDDGFSRNLLDLAGAGLDGLRGRLKLACGDDDADNFLMYHAGLLAQRPISAAGVETLVRGLLGVAVRFRSFVGNFIVLQPRQQSSLGQRNCEIGRSAMLGSRQYDCQTRATLEIGPLQTREFSDLLPGGSSHVALQALLRFCVGHTLAIDVRLILARDSVPAPHLSAKAVVPKQLGFNTWIRSRPVERDRDDCCYELRLDAQAKR